MNQTPDQPARGIALADARPHRRWSTGAKVLVYVLFFILAVGAIWLIDRRVDALAGL